MSAPGRGLANAPGLMSNRGGGDGQPCPTCGGSGKVGAGTGGSIPLQPDISDLTRQLVGKSSAVAVPTPQSTAPAPDSNEAYARRMIGGTIRRML